MILKRSTCFTLTFTLVAIRMATGQMTPIQTVEAAFDAFTHSDWRTLVSLVHPDALAAFRADQLGSAVGYTTIRLDPRMQHRNIGFTPSDFVTADAIQRVKAFRLEEFPGAPMVGELAALSPSDFFVRWCEAAFR